MTQSFICRKRCRSDCDEESSEFTPLSKRINNLHINNTLLTATATVETRCHNNHHECMNNLVPQSVNINDGVSMAHDQNQWNGVLVNGMSQHHHHHGNLEMNGRDMIDPAATSVQEYVSRHLLQQEQHNPTVIQHYNPDLSPSENPYYYENNRLLFTLYMERLQRTNNCNYVIN